MLTFVLGPKLREFHFHFSFQQHQSSHGLCTGAAVLVQVFWFLSAALHVLVCFLPSNLSFIKLHHTVPLFHSVFVWRVFFPSFFCLGFWKVYWEDFQLAPLSSKHSWYWASKPALPVSGLWPWIPGSKHTMWVNRAVAAAVISNHLRSWRNHMLQLCD